MAQPTAGISALVRRLRRGQAAQQATASSTLNEMLLSAGRPDQFDALAASMAAAGAIPPLVQMARTSRNDTLIHNAVTLLGNLAFGNPQCADAITAAAGVEALVQLMRSGSVDYQSRAAVALVNMLTASPDATTAALDAAGALAVAIQRLRSSDAPLRWRASILLGGLALESQSRRQAIHSAGGITPLVTCLQRASTDGIGPYTSAHAC